MLQQKAQGSLEYLLLIGGAVVVGSIVIVLLLGAAGSGSSQVSLGAGTATVKTALVSQAVGYWQFNGSYADSSLSSNAGSPVGAATFANDATRGTVLSLNGSAMVLANNTIQNPVPFTAAAWIKPNSITSSAWQSVMAEGCEGFDLTVIWNGDLAGGRNCGSSYINGPILSSVQSNNGWYHIALTFDGSTTRLYLQGNKVAENSQITYQPATYLCMGSNCLYYDDPKLGYPQFSESFSGLISNEVLLTRALSDDEVKALAGS